MNAPAPSPPVFAPGSWSESAPLCSRCPFAIGLSLPAVVTGVVVGILAIGLGLAGTAPEGRGTIPISAHAVYDAGLAAGLILTAVAFAVYGETAAAAFFFATGLVQLVLSAITRYTAGRSPSFLR